MKRGPIEPNKPGQESAVQPTTSPDAAAQKAADRDTGGQVSGVWRALEVRSSELAQVKRLFVAAFLVGLALVTFFSGSNALFLDQVGADRLPWVYIANAPLVIGAGLLYPVCSRRRSTAAVLVGSLWLLSATVAALWLWSVVAGSAASAFVLAVWFRFLFIYGLLGLWEVASATFDVRQAKRLFPAVALGAMLAFMLGGAAISAITPLIGTEQLIALSAGCFALYAIAFRGAIAPVDFGETDEDQPATPKAILTDRLARDLALMRMITILLIFVTEFIFYSQVQNNIGGDAAIARFLGVFLAGSTLAMVIVTATVSAPFIRRFGVGAGIATMPAGLLLVAVAMGLWGVFVGVDRGFFVLVIVANVLNMVLANAIETPVGAVLYQPMPAERRMPVRIAVDGWLGSVGVLLVGLVLLAFDALQLDGTLPFVWLLAAGGTAGVVLAKRLYSDYRNALDEATTLAFFGSGRQNTLTDLLVEAEGQLANEGPGAAFALALTATELDSSDSVVAPHLLTHPNPEIAAMAVAAVRAACREGSSARVADHHEHLVALAEHTARPAALRAQALETLAMFRLEQARRVAANLVLRTEIGDPLWVQCSALLIAESESAEGIERLAKLANAESVDDRISAAAILAVVPIGEPLPSRAVCLLFDLLDDDEPTVRLEAIRALPGRVDRAAADRLVTLAEDTVLRRRSVAALATGATIAIEAIDARIDELAVDLVVDLVDHVYARSTRSPRLLHRFLEPTTATRLRRAGFDANRIADIDLPATVGRMVRDDVEWAQTLVDVRRATAGDETLRADERTLVLLAIADEFRSTRRTIWAGLRSRGGSDRIGELEVFAAGANVESRSNAIEALDGLLDRATRDLVLPVLEPRDIADAVETMPRVHEFESIGAALNEMRLGRQLTRATSRLFDRIAPVDSAGPPADPPPTSSPSLDSELSMSAVFDRVLALKSVDIFSTLPYDLLVELASLVEHRSVDKGQTVIEEGEIDDRLFALVEGDVVVGDRAIRLSTGTVFGELAVLAPGPRNATVTAATDCSLLILDRQTLLALTDRRPEVMAEIARVLATRLQSTPVRQ